MQRRVDGEERARSSALLLSVVARLLGALGLLDVLLSVGGQSFVAPFFTAPQGQCCVFSLDVAVGQVGGHKRKYAAMLQWSSRAGVKVSMLSLLLGARSSCWVVGILGLDFRGMVLKGRISARRKVKC